MFKKFFNWLFRRNTQPTPTPPVVIIEEPSLPVNVPLPTTGGRVLDHINNGSPKNPDHKYLYDNLVIDNDKQSTVAWYVEQFRSHKNRYSKVTANTGVPEWFIFLLHIRECSLSFAKVLHNGQTLTHVNRWGTTWVPKGRGKAKGWTWEDAAVDALQIKNYHNKASWSLELTLPDLEKWNGLGYRKRIGDRGQVEYSPFILAGSEFHDETSKYVSDGKYDRYAKEKQLGVFTILKGLELKGLVNLF